MYCEQEAVAVRSAGYPRRLPCAEVRAGDAVEVRSILSCERGSKLSVFGRILGGENLVFWKMVD